jgi:hypothetical protein
MALKLSFGIPAVGCWLHMQTTKAYFWPNSPQDSLWLFGAKTISSM